MAIQIFMPILSFPRFHPSTMTRDSISTDSAQTSPNTKNLLCVHHITPRLKENKSPESERPLFIFIYHRNIQVSSPEGFFFIFICIFASCEKKHTLQEQHFYRSLQSRVAPHILIILMKKERAKLTAAQ